MMMTVCCILTSFNLGSTNGEAIEPLGGCPVFRHRVPRAGSASEERRRGQGGQMIRDIMIRSHGAHTLSSSLMIMASERSVYESRQQRF
ncbi:hypothetical protein BU24DRAFT_160470 [Aaosphaeria arxii CBS 175.79]|uniref:Secreted protein n=1 Tax=Aaosphaeria arxii CBS 175.79 TaxID=1450172 RepID=A0A6A5XWY0_9PLEO|nr:uncharacterized protein BU24DRAFT_160470 [Aaosphaeria arxii CBS 175.79]KAF2017838.1 hypothetical protein BU24DRAFT_160470 [Aaosphaeria arxii CBS 175.79]